MKVLSVIGKRGSGKTTVVEALVKELHGRGYTVGTVKKMHCPEFHLESDNMSNTRRHQLAGADIVVSFAEAETVYFVEKKSDINSILNNLSGSADFLLIEGGHELAVPRIVCGWEACDVIERADESTFLVSGRISDAHPSGFLNGIPVMNPLTDISRMADKAVQNASRVSLPVEIREKSGYPAKICLHPCEKKCGSEEKKELTHFDQNGNAVMVDVSQKETTARRAVAQGTIRVSEDVFHAVADKAAAKGDVLTVATIAGIQCAKRTWEIIPLCHILPLTNCSISWEMREENFEIICTCVVCCNGQTGVEMEALTGVSTALLTVYDMCKAMDKWMQIGDIRLLEKEGGKSGHLIQPAAGGKDHE